jgi:hypothetical protein
VVNAAGEQATFSCRIVEFSQFPGRAFLQACRNITAEETFTDYTALFGPMTQGPEGTAGNPIEL